MIKKLALLPIALLAGCSMFGAENTNPAAPDSKGTQQEPSSITAPERTTQIPESGTQLADESTVNTKKTSKQENINSPQTLATTQTQNKEPSPSTAAPKQSLSINIPAQANILKPTTTSIDQSPIAMLDNSILAIQTTLEKRSDEINNNPKELKLIIDKYLLPNVDTNKIAAMMLGPKWRTATEQQKTKFIKQFLILLTSIYSKNIAKVGAYQVIFNSLSDSVWKDKKYVQVTGKVLNIKNSNTQGSNITVYIIDDNNKWKIYDIAVEGISIMQNYQSQFRPISSMNDVIKGVERVNARTKG